MYYDFEPEYHNPPSNQWFGYQTWPMERVAEYYYETGNAQAKAILAKWVSWAESVTTFNTTTGAICLPGHADLVRRSRGELHHRHLEHGAPPANTGLHVSVSGCSGRPRRGRLAGQGVRVLRGQVRQHHRARPQAQNIIDVIHKFYGDSLGFSAPETRTDYSNFTSAFNTTNFEGVFIPSGWTGSYPGWHHRRSPPPTNTFLSIRPVVHQRPANGPRSRPT